MKKYSSNQSGRSMIEMLGVLAIVGVLSVAGIAGYSKAMAKYKTNKLIDQVSTIVANTKTKFVAQGNYKGLSVTTAYSLGIFPEEMVKDCTDSKCTPMLAIGYLVNLGAALYSSFQVSLYNLSKDGCTALVTADWGSSTGFDGIFGTVEGCVAGVCPPSVLKEKGLSMVNALCTGTEGKNDYYLSLYFR